MNTRTRGVSLLEVLISIFVLSVGLMGVAALIPAGGFNIAEANKADRSATCGRAALRDVRVRSLLDDAKWTAPAIDDEPTLLDPLGPTVRFPYCDYATLAPGFPVESMQRVGLAGMSRPAAETIFFGRDDLVFAMPENDDERPTAINDGTGKHPAHCHYSWMVMLDPDGIASVIVFHKRDFTDPPTLSQIGPDNPTPSERVSVAEFIGRHPVDVTLSMPLEPSAARLGTGISEYLDAHEQDWIMLTNGKEFKWYRVLSVANELTNGTRLVTLAGPDWVHDKFDLNGDGKTDELQAVICEGVIGVYTQPN